MPSCPITPPPDQMPSPRAARAIITIAATINPVRHDMTDGLSESVGREHESDRGGNQSNSGITLIDHVRKYSLGTRVNTQNGPPKWRTRFVTEVQHQSVVWGSCERPPSYTK